MNGSLNHTRCEEVENDMHESANALMLMLLFPQPAD